MSEWNVDCPRLLEVSVHVDEKVLTCMIDSGATCIVLYVLQLCRISWHKSQMPHLSLFDLRMGRRLSVIQRLFWTWSSPMVLTIRCASSGLR